MHDVMGEPIATDTSKTSWTSAAAQVVAALAVLGGIVLIGLALFGGSDDDAATGGVGERESLNISCFVYRDTNRNGTYDLGDRPYSALLIDGIGPDGTVTAASNPGGFANFQMLLGGDGVLVAAPGSYRFEARLPDGWEVSSGTATRTIEFVELEGAPAGIVAVEQCEPYGLVPMLSIRGPIPSGSEVEVESDAGPVDVEIVDGVEFRAEVSAGSWTVTMSDGDVVHSRIVDVADAPVVLSAVADRDETTAPLTDPVIVGFDDFTTVDTITEIPNGYGGLDWANWVSTHRVVYGGPGYVNVGTSGEFVAYNSSGHPAAISSDVPFDFVGGYFGVAWPAAEQYDIVLEAWSGDSRVAFDTFRGTISGPLYFAADYRSVTRIEISSTANWQFVVDDLEFRTEG